jgi:hypothetical protein
VVVKLRRFLISALNGSEWLRYGRFTQLVRLFLNILIFGMTSGLNYIITRSSIVFLLISSGQAGYLSGIALGNGLDDRGSSPGKGWEIFSSPHVQNGSGAHPPSYPMGTKGSFPGGKVAGA